MCSTAVGNVCMCLQILQQWFVDTASWTIQLGIFLFGHCNAIYKDIQLWCWCNIDCHTFSNRCRTGDQSKNILIWKIQLELHPLNTAIIILRQLSLHIGATFNCICFACSLIKIFPVGNYISICLFHHSIEIQTNLSIYQCAQCTTPYTFRIQEKVSLTQAFYFNAIETN